MAKKVYDVKPPRVAKKTERKTKKIVSEEIIKKNPVVATAVVSKRKKPEKYFPWKMFYGGVAVVIILLVGVLYFKLQKVTIEIWPEVTNLNYTQTISADKSANSVVLADSAIPAKYVEFEKTGSEEFFATGNASDEGRAGGTVTMYNKLGTSLTLKINTHILSDSGKYFITLAKVTIPAGSKSKPGSVKVKVRAVEGGESYNISPATFSVPGLSGTNYYYSTYAESSEAMTGGYDDDVKKVTEDDISEAKKSLTEKVLSEAIEELRSTLDEDYILLDDAISSVTINAESDTKSGTVVEKFKYEVSLKINGLVFKKSDLDKFTKDYIISQMAEDYTILESSLATDYSVKSIDITDGNMLIDVDFLAGTYKSVNKNSLSLLLTGKTDDQITETINNNLGDSTSRINVKFWPFWVTRSPKNQKAIEIELKF